MGIARIKKKDVGLEFLQKIHFTRRPGQYAVSNELLKRIGREETLKFFETWQSLEDASKEFYDLKNQNIDISTVVSEHYDSEIIRNFCNYLYDNREYIKGEVLDIGCESGFMTAFLAMYFPDIHITAIDRSERAIAVARERLERLGITNVQFKVADIKDLDEQYDTVISMRTLAENIDIDVVQWEIFDGADFAYQFRRNKEELQPYADGISRRLKDNGHLISIERIQISSEMYGWLAALNDDNCGFIPDTFKYILCKDGDDEGFFTAFVAENGAARNDEDLRQFVMNILKNAKDDHDGWTSRTSCKGWPAIIHFFDHKGECIADNFIIENTGDHLNCVGRFAAYYDKDDPNTVYYIEVVDSYYTTQLDVMDGKRAKDAAAKVEMRTKMQERNGYKRGSAWPISSN